MHILKSAVMFPSRRMKIWWQTITWEHRLHSYRSTLEMAFPSIVYHCNLSRKRFPFHVLLDYRRLELLKYLVLPGWRTVKSMALSFSLESSVLLAVGPFKEILSVSGTPSLKKYVIVRRVFVIWTLFTLSKHANIDKEGVRYKTLLINIEEFECPLTFWDFF